MAAEQVNEDEVAEAVRRLVAAIVSGEDPPDEVRVVVKDQRRPTTNPRRLTS